MLENCENFDNDIRFTGANDLCNEIMKASDKLEESVERRICSAFIKQLDDTNLEVKSNAVKCIQRITPKIRENHLTTIVNKLITDIASASKAEALDILSLTVRGIVTDSRESYAPTLISSVAPHLLRGIESGSAQVQEECLDICTEIFKRFGLIILRQPSLVNKDQLMNAINNQLTHGSKLSLRKRASYAMGSFAVVLNQAQLNKLISLLLQKLQSQQEKSDTIIQLQCMSIIAKSIGSKLGPHLREIIPILIRFSSRLNHEASVDEDNELAESALITLEAIIRKCANEVTGYIEDLISSAFSLMEYDPNYTYFDDEDEKMDEDGGGWGDDDEEGWYGGDEDQDDDADDDTSWKVRRAAVGIIDVIVKTRPEFVKRIIIQQADVLIDRVKERNMDVKVEILKVLEVLISSSMDVVQQSIELDLLSQTSLKRQLSASEGLKERQAVIVKALVKPLKSKKDKVKVAAIEALSAFACLV